MPMAMLDSRNHFTFSPVVVLHEEVGHWLSQNNITRVLRHTNPALLIAKHGCFSAGHCIMENLFPLAINLQSWELPYCATAGCDVFDNTVIQMEVSYDDGKDCGCHYRTECGLGRDCGPCGETNDAERRASCAYFAQDILGALSRRPPVYLSQLDSFDARSGTLECWGANRQGPLGDGTDTGARTPRVVS